MEHIPKETGDAQHVHRWEVATGWYGDPNVINGTETYTYWKCRCGEETTDQPDDWVEEPEMEWDHGRD